MTAKTDLAESLSKSGYLHLTDTGLEELDTILDRLGKLVSVTDIEEQPASTLYIHSRREIPFHNEGPAARYLLWYCMEPANDGGDTVLVPAIEVERQLSTATLQMLGRTHCWLHNPLGPPTTHPILVEHGSLPVWCYVPWALSGDMTDHQQEAVSKLEVALNRSDSFCFRMKSRDLVVLDNHRVFHRRTGYTGKRLIRRFLATDAMDAT